MKKYGKTIVVISVLIALGLGYYYYLANRQGTKDATDIAADNSEYAVLTSRDIMSNYPESPKEVVKYYARITKAYYDTQLSDEQIEALGKQARLLFDDELKKTQTDSQFLSALKDDVKSYRAADRRISSYAIQSATKTRYTTFQDRQYASIVVQYYIREGNELINAYHRFMLRKDNDGHWKILYWELVDVSDFDE